MRLFRYLAFILMIAFFIGLVFVYYELNKPIIGPEQHLTYHLKPHSTLHDVSRYLRKQNLVFCPKLLTTYARITGADLKIQAGQYALLPNSSIISLLGQLTAGKVIEYKFTIVEGWRFDEIIQAMKTTPNLKHNAKADWQHIRKQLALNIQNPEGQFLPLTYYFKLGDDDLSILKRAHKLLITHLDETWEKRDKTLPYKNKHALLTVASLLERESMHEDERLLISSVVVNRLKKHMRLQMDPSVRFALRLDPKKPVSYKHTRTPHPYNTYKIRGLPPGPIGTCSANAIYSAAHPKHSDFYYFVAIGKDGRHVFNRTLKAHNLAKQKWKQVQRYERTVQTLSQLINNACKPARNADILDYYIFSDT